MTKTDGELDRDWKPSGRRPQSTIARSFSQELVDIFRIENSVADLDEQVDKRKQNVVHQTTELEALEARIREMESVLQKNTNVGAALSSAAHARGSLNGVFGADHAQSASATPEAAAATVATQDSHDRAAPRPLEHRQRPPTGHSDNKYSAAGSRPGTARASQQAVPGALPPTPVGSEDGDTERY